MQIISRLVLALVLVISSALQTPLRAATIEKRIALVVGNADYRAGALATAANDAGLVAQTLQAAGFDVIGARDLDGESLRRAFKDFTDKAAEAGPGTVVAVYLAGYGLQLDGENYFAPVDATIGAAADVPSEALRISDYTKRLASLPLGASFIILDGARSNPFAASGEPLAGGLALVDADPAMLVAFNATPGSVAPAEPGPYGAYATALAEMIREGGLSVAELFDRVRLRVNEATKGAEVPWNVSRITTSFVFFERTAGAPASATPIGQAQAIGAEPISALGARDAYAAALYRDTLQDYEDFLAAYPNDPMAPRVRALVALRREAITWLRTCRNGTPNAYWSYLGRYPRGPHAANARWRLSRLSVAAEPPPSYVPIAYDVPPPPPPEFVYVARPFVVFSDPVYAFVPPPPPPIIFLPPPPPAFVVLPPPPPPVVAYVLPDPPFVPLATWVNPPAYVAPPPSNIIFNNIHNETIINTTTSTTIVNPMGAGAGVQPARVPGAAVIGAGVVGAGVVGAGVIAGAIAARVALPPSVVRKATSIPPSEPIAPGSRPLNPALPGVGRPTPAGMPIPQTQPFNAPPSAPALPGAVPPTSLPLGKPDQAASPASPGAVPPGQLQGTGKDPSGNALPGADGRVLVPPGAAPPAASGKPDHVAPSPAAGTVPVHPSRIVPNRPLGQGAPRSEGHVVPQVRGKPTSGPPFEKGLYSQPPQGSFARPPVPAMGPSNRQPPPPAVARPMPVPVRQEPAFSPRHAAPLGQPPAFPRTPAMAPPPQSQPARIQAVPMQARPPQPPAAQFRAQPIAPYPQPAAPRPQPGMPPHPPQAPQQRPPCGQPGLPPCH